jgi:hypothetical protein
MAHPRNNSLRFVEAGAWTLICNKDFDCDDASIWLALQVVNRYQVIYLMYSSDRSLGPLVY